jgi:hypothetical protein
MVTYGYRIESLRIYDAGNSGSYTLV